MKSIAQIRAIEKTADLVAFYNANVNDDDQIKKFSDRATAIRRCVELGKKMDLPEYSEDELKALNPEAQAAVKAAEAAAKAEIKEATEKADANARGVFNALFGMTKEQKEAHENGNGKGVKVQDGKIHTEEEAKPEPVYTGRASNSAGVAASWANPEVMAARLTRHGVAVTVSEDKEFHQTADAKEFKSTRDAFRFFRLPDSKHIRFRMALKAEGTNTFEMGGKYYHFELREISKPEVVPAEGEEVKK
jgi:hypothetical protein